MNTFRVKEAWEEPRPTNSHRTSGHEVTTGQQSLATCTRSGLHNSRESLSFTSYTSFHHGHWSPLASAH